MSAWAVFGIGVAIACALQLSLWVLQTRIGDASYVDVGWAYGIGILAVVYAVLGGGSSPHRSIGVDADAEGIGTAGGGFDQLF